MKRLVGWGIFMVVVGLWIWLSALGVPYMEFRRDWPLLIVAAGIAIIVRRIRRHIRQGRSQSQIIADLEAGKIDVEKAIIQIRRSK